MTRELSAMAQDYVKILWSATEWSDQPVTTKHLAQRLDVAPSTVSENIRKLRDQGLVDHAKYGDIALTTEGHAHAVAMVRRHRIIETYLVERLGYQWDQVHDEAEILEHACSDRMIDAMDAALGHPTRDPHGDPIPQPDGTVPQPAATVLSDVQPGTWAIARISDSDPAMLRYFVDVGLTVDATLTVLPPQEYADGVTVTVTGHDAPITLGAAAAGAIWVASTTPNA